MNRRIPDIINMLRSLIGTPSVSSAIPEFDMGNRKVIELLASWLDDLGFVVAISPVNTEHDKYNLLATLGAGNDGLVLSGHTDTVPYQERSWRTDPFTLTETGGRLYGLGTSDMKAFFAFALEVASELDPKSLRQPLSLLATADEESTMAGAKSFAAQQHAPGRFVLIGEPTGLRPVRMHKGVLMEAIRVHGRAGHSSNPRLGVSALEGMHRVIACILTWRDELQRHNRNPHFDVPYPTLNLGRIHGGDNPNRICEDCELQIDLRPLPGMDHHGLRENLRDRIQSSLRGSPFRVTFKSLFEGVPGLETDHRSRLVEIVEGVTGQPSQAVAFGTEGPFFKRMGMETVVLGPGDIEQAHQPNEFLAANRIQPMMALLRSVVQQLCVAENPLALQELKRH